MINQLAVTVARLPEEAITVLDERIDELWRDEGGDYETGEYITDDMMSTFNLLTIGYDAAWTEVERLSAALEEAQKKIDDVGNSLEINRMLLGKANYEAIRQRRFKETAEARLAEAQQTIARQREVIEQAREYCNRESYAAAESVLNEFEEGETQP